MSLDYVARSKIHIGRLQTKWFGKLFSKQFCIIHFYEHQKLSRTIVLWNRSGNVVALRSKSPQKTGNHLWSYWASRGSQYGYQNDSLLIVRVLTELDFEYRTCFRYYSKMHFWTFHYQQNVFFVIKNDQFQQIIAQNDQWNLK